MIGTSHLSIDENSSDLSSTTALKSKTASPSRPDLILPLQKLEHHWVATDSASTRHSLFIAERKVRALLNKLTFERFESISNQVIDWVNKSEKENDGHTLILASNLVFEGAIDETSQSELFARLCRKMMERISPDIHDESVKAADGRPITGGRLFRRYLLNRCQEDFERGWTVKEAVATAALNKAVNDKNSEEAHEAKEKVIKAALYLDEPYDAEKARRRGLGLVKFIGELFKLAIITERVMLQCIKKLLINVDDPEDEDIESLCELLRTAGQTLDTGKNRSHMVIYFAKMTELSNNKNISLRVRFMLLDVIEMRNRKWIARNAVAAPTTIAQVHAAAAKEKDNLSRGMSRGGSHSVSRRHEAFGTDGWRSKADGRTPNPTTKGDSFSGFPKITKSATPVTSAPCSVFKRDGKRREPPSFPRNESTANVFPMLYSGVEGLDITSSSRVPSFKPRFDLPALHRKHNLLPQSVGPRETAERSVAIDEATPALQKTATEAQAKTRIAEDIKEFWNIRNVEETLYYFESLPPTHHHLLVAELVTSAINEKEADVILVSEVFVKVAEAKLCSQEAFIEGLRPTVESVDDLSVDVPKAYSFVARLLRGSKLPQSAVEELASKIVVDTNPLIHPSLKLMNEYTKLK